MPAQCCVGWALPKAAEPSPTWQGAGIQLQPCPVPCVPLSASLYPSMGMCWLQQGCPLCLTSLGVICCSVHDPELSVFACQPQELPSHTSHPSVTHCLQALPLQPLCTQSCVCPWQRTWGRAGRVTCDWESHRMV